MPPLNPFSGKDKIDPLAFCAPSNKLRFECVGYWGKNFPQYAVTIRYSIARLNFELVDPKVGGVEPGASINPKMVSAVALKVEDSPFLGTRRAAQF